MNITKAVLKAISYGDGLEKSDIKRIQLRYKGGRDLKFVRAQALMAEYLFLQYEEGGTAIKLMSLCTSHKKLFQAMSKVGFVYTAYNRMWRLDKRLKSVRDVEL